MGASPQTPGLASLDRSQEKVMHGMAAAAKNLNSFLQAIPLAIQANSLASKLFQSAYIHCSILDYW